LIIDSHVHICGPPLNQEYIKGRLWDGSTITLPVKRADASVDCLIRDMNENKIDKAFVCAMNDVATNECLSKAVRKHNGRIVGFAWIDNPLDEKQSVEALERAVDELGLRGLKLHPGIQNFSPGDSRVYPLVRKAAELQIPVFIHMTPWPLGTFANHKPEHIDTLKRNVPDATVIVGHMAWQRFIDLLALVRTPGIYFETSNGLNMIAGLYGVDFAERLIRRLGVDKVVFGSDWMGSSSRMTKENMDLINKMNLTREEKQKILGENIRKVLVAN
jgi:predicted TIM-barrel fold metal-dependent hydrolase